MTRKLSTFEDVSVLKDCTCTPCYAHKSVITRLDRPTHDALSNTQSIDLIKFAVQTLDQFKDQLSESQITQLALVSYIFPI